MPPSNSRITKLLLLCLAVALVLLGAWVLYPGNDAPQTSAGATPAASPVSPANAGAPPEPAAPSPVASSTVSQQPGAVRFPAAVAPTAATPAPALQQVAQVTPAAAPTVTAPPATMADVLQGSGDLSDPENRRRAVEQMQRIENTRKTEAWARADRDGIPKRIERPDGTVQELVAFDGDRPVYFTTYNANAAISSGANLLLATPYQVNGGDLTVGVWDGGSVLTTHQEFGGRVIAKDGASPIDHATHVGGTIAAAGLVASAKGMAPAVNIHSYDWNSDKSEMTSRGASYPGEPGTLYLSNHSYGYIAGWNYTGKASPQWDWWGAGTTSTSVDDNFGKYTSYARDSDSLANSLQYYLVFRAAGNDRGDSPAPGSPVALSANGTTVVSYDPALHPAGDSSYKGGGYDTLSFDALAKNVMTIGGVNDAVSGGLRQPANGTMTWFSSWGPTDDGRIKPDLVANGDSLYSTLAGSNASYGYLSGTSMATPSAMGTAAMVIDYFGKLFPGHALRASTLKGLLIETADDLGAAGPDYQYGWGLMNARAAADLIRDYRNSPGTKRIVEDRVTTARSTVSHSFVYSGSGPIRATLCWTDPAASVSTTGDSRTARLVNNLDVQLTGPDGSVYQPFVMPYVGDWTAAKLSAPAVTGKNNTDNVEQVLIAAPSVAGTYTATVTFSGTLTNGAQNFSLLISGGAPTATALPPTATAVSPNAANGGAATLTLTGGDFLLGAEVKLTRTGQPDVPTSGVEVLGDSLKARVNTAGVAPGLWNVVVTNPDGQSCTLANAFSVVGALWTDNLESGATGWTHSAATGTDGWSLSTAQSQSPSHAFFTPGAATKSESFLVSPAIAIPNGSANLQLSFWHSYAFQNGRDGGVLEFSLDNGSWFDVTAAGSGAAFAGGGYNSTISSTGNPNSRNPLAGLRAWSGSTTGFTQVLVNLTDATRYAGKSLRVRWRIGTDSSTASVGWYIDSLSLAGATPGNLPPSIVTQAASPSSPVTGTSTALSVSATDDAGDANLLYTWTVNDDFTAPVSFSDNGTASAKQTTATFSKSGLYTFTATVRDSQGLVATSSVDVQVDQTLTGVTISPGVASLGAGSTLQFTPSAVDQFGKPMAQQPLFTWSAAGGTISTGGLFTAGNVPGGPFLVTATTGLLSATADITLTGQTFATWQAAHFTAEEILSGLASQSSDTDGDGLTNLLEYALGADPRDPANIGVLTTGLEPDSAGEARLTLTFTRPKALPGISYVVEVSSDLTLWTEVPTLEITASSASSETVTARDPVRAADAVQRAARLRVRQTVP